MEESNPFRISRRRFMEMAAGLTVLAACGESGSDSGPVATGVTSTLLQPSTKLSGDLKILQWSHFVPRHDQWFDPFAKRLGHRCRRQRHRRPHRPGRDPGPGRRRDRRRRGPRPHRVHLPARLAGAERPRPDRHQQGGRAPVRQADSSCAPAAASTRPPRSSTASATAGPPTPATTARASGRRPACPTGPRTYEELLTGGGRINAEQKIALGIGMSNEIDSNMAARAMIWSFGGSVQDADENVVDQLPRDDRRGRVHDQAVQGCDDRRGVRLERRVEQPGTDRRAALLHPQLDLGLPVGPEEQPGRGRRRLLHRPAQGPGRRRAGLGARHPDLRGPQARQEPRRRQGVHPPPGGELRAATNNTELYTFPSFPDTVPELDAWLDKDPYGSKPENKLALPEGRRRAGAPTSATPARPARRSARFSAPSSSPR